MESGERLSECVLESDDVEVAMATGGRGKERRWSSKTILGRQPAQKLEG